MSRPEKEHGLQAAMASDPSLRNRAFMPPSPGGDGSGTHSKRTDAYESLLISAISLDCCSASCFCPDIRLRCPSASSRCTCASRSSAEASWPRSSAPAADDPAATLPSSPPTALTAESPSAAALLLSSPPCSTLMPKRDTMYFAASSISRGVAITRCPLGRQNTRRTSCPAPLDAAAFSSSSVLPGASLRHSNKTVLRSSSSMSSLSTVSSLTVSRSWCTGTTSSPAHCLSSVPSLASEM
mmetsp:Transcript_45042/g.134437  ORF Transcript_45042/g.134437 Transcript_45042/m.134437 type:complete len:240 (-) Transcript_45042:4601-5320(-)|eukprot:365554-Chlamydomonas_euryale.AAC.12